MFSLSKFCSSYYNRFLLENVCQSAFFLQQRCVRSRSVPSLDGLPEKPKRPPSAWLLFLAERYKKLRGQAEYEELSLMEMSKKISEEWRSFDELDKIPYMEKYGELLSEYRHRMKDYKSSLTPADKRLLRLAKLGDVKEFEKEFPKPKYPGSGYILFVKSDLEENPRQENPDMKQWIRDCASKWQSLDEDSKQSFNEQASPPIKKYREELKDWKEKYEEWKKSDAASN